MSVLFVTSFTASMFHATGRRLVQSFLDTGTEGRLLICHEDFCGSLPFSHPAIDTFDIMSAPLLSQWLEDNRDIIPARFGGIAAACSCPDAGNPFGRHRPRCHGYWFNLNAARWFRKVVALDHAVSRTGADSIVWLDSDCVMKARIPETEVNGWFRGASVFYLKSAVRRAMESGVIGIRNTDSGRTFVSATVARYRTGVFRRNVRWDDGYQFQLTLRNHPEIPAIDLATRPIGDHPFGHVVPLSPVGKFLFHQKGIHGRMLNLST